MLRILHTADWHLGKRFPLFDESDQKKLSRARMDVVGRILDLGRRNAVNAVVCAGDLFDEPNPAADFWEGLAKILRDRPEPQVPVFLLPGNHDPLTHESVWSRTHPFRSKLPAWAHVVDRDDFTYDLGPEAVFYARPCRSKAGQDDPALLLPPRAAGDQRVRIGCVHGSTFEMPGYQTNFPIARNSGLQRGFDYLAIGDTHSFRDVTPELPVATVYPGAPEATSFDEPQAGHVAIVSLFRAGTRPRVHAERVAYWKWLEMKCRDLNELRALLTYRELDRHVVRLKLEMKVTVAEEAEVDRILRELKGTDASHGRVGVLLVDRSELRLRPGSGDVFHEHLPPVIRDVVNRLDRLSVESLDEVSRERATRALSHLYKLLQQQDAIGGSSS